MKDIGIELANFWERKHVHGFDWRTNNCCLFAADWALQWTGRDPAAGFRSELSSPVRALRIMDEAGGVEQLAARICASHGWREVALGEASRGDIVLADVPDGSGAALGVCAGAHSWFVAAACIHIFPTLSCRRAWRLN